MMKTQAAPRPDVIYNGAGSGASFSRLRSIRDRIAKRETEIEVLVSEARQRSNRRVRRRGEQLDAGNELEETLLELEAVGRRSSSKSRQLRERQLSLQQEMKAKRLDLIANSPPFVLKLEQALAIVARVEKGEFGSSGIETRPKQTRWHSSLVSLMKEVSDSIKRRKQLASHSMVNDKDARLDLAAASARLLSLHINAWSIPTISRELNHIWLMAVSTEADINPQFKGIYEAWQAVKRKIEHSSLSAVANEKSETELAGEVMQRVCDCTLRAGVRAEVEKVGWWQQWGEEFLQKDLSHLNSKVAPLSSRGHLATRYNLLLAKCAEIGAWETAISTYRSMKARCDTHNSGSKRGNTTLDQPLPGPIVYQHLLRAAKNAMPPRPRAALSVLWEMRSRGATPSASHYNIVVSACARAAAVAGTQSIASVVHTTGELCSCRSGIKIKGNCANDGDQGDTGTPGKTEDARDLGASSDGGPDLGKTECNREDSGRKCVGEAKASRTSTSSRKSGARKESLASAKAADLPLPDTRCTLQPRLRINKATGNALNDGGALTLRRRPRFRLGTSSIAGAVTDTSKMASQSSTSEPATAQQAVRLALDVVVDMGEHSIVPSEATYKTLVEAGRCSALGPALPCSLAGGVRAALDERGLDVLSSACSPKDVYAALKTVGIPESWCYDAGIGNALRGGRRYPAYVAQTYR